MLSFSLGYPQFTTRGFTLVHFFLVSSAFISDAALLILSEYLWACSLPKCVIRVSIFSSPHVLISSSFDKNDSGLIP